jgi:transcriptional regulator with XRE-family HTH domain
VWLDEYLALWQFQSMTLNEYLAERQLTPHSFARLLGVAASTVHRWLNVRTKGGALRRPSIRLLPKIEQVTGGKVTAKDFYLTTEAAE